MLTHRKQRKISEYTLVLSSLSSFYTHLYFLIPKIILHIIKMGLSTSIIVIKIIS